MKVLNHVLNERQRVYIIPCLDSVYKKSYDRWSSKLFKMLGNTNKKECTITNDCT